MQTLEILALTSANANKTSLAVDLGNLTVYSIQADFLGYQSNTLTFPALIGATAGDYIVITDGNGLNWAAALNTTGSAPAPTGAAYTAIPAGRKVNVDISGTTTAATVAAAVKLALNALSGFTSVITLNDTAADGTMIVTQLVTGTVAAPVPHNAADSGAGSITVSASSAAIVGSLYLESSIDNIFWSTITGSTQAVNKTAVDFPYAHTWSEPSGGYRYVRAVWTYTSGSATLLMKAFLKDQKYNPN